MGLAEKVFQTVETTDNQTLEYRLAGDTSTIEALMLEDFVRFPSVYEKL